MLCKLHTSSCHASTLPGRKRWPTPICAANVPAEGSCPVQRQLKCWLLLHLLLMLLLTLLLPVRPVHSRGLRGVIHAGKEANTSELSRAVPLELGCMEANHLSSMACKVSSTDRPDLSIDKRRGRQVKPLWANGCLVAKHLMSRKRRPACLTTN